MHSINQRAGFAWNPVRDAAEESGGLLELVSQLAVSKDRSDLVAFRGELGLHRHGNIVST